MAGLHEKNIPDPFVSFEQQDVRNKLGRGGWQG
jgi:hypothetical protein